VVKRGEVQLEARAGGNLRVFPLPPLPRSGASSSLRVCSAQSAATPTAQHRDKQIRACLSSHLTLPVTFSTSTISSHLNILHLHHTQTHHNNQCSHQTSNPPPTAADRPSHAVRVEPTPHPNFLGFCANFHARSSFFHHSSSTTTSPPTLHPWTHLPRPFSRHDYHVSHILSTTNPHHCHHVRRRQLSHPRQWH
jgi:hypothetical protein